MELIMVLLKSLTVVEEVALAPQELTHLQLLTQVERVVLVYNLLLEEL
jgi:hypothetical protein